MKERESKAERERVYSVCVRERESKEKRERESLCERDTINHGLFRRAGVIPFPF